MNQLPSWVSKVQAGFIALGTFLTILAFQGVQFPDFLLKLFTQGTWDVIFQTVTSVFTFYQYMKGIFVVTPVAPDAKLSILGKKDVVSYAFNPFRISR